MSATTRVSDSQWSIVGGDPAPGEPDGIRAKADVYRSIADNARTCHDNLVKLGSSTLDSWTGSAADACRDQLDHHAKLPSDLVKLDASYTLASDALRRYGSRLAELQQEASAAVNKAMAAHDDEQRTLPIVSSKTELVKSLGRDVQRQQTVVKQLRVSMSSAAYLDPNNQPYRDDVNRRYNQAVSTLNRLTADRADAERKLNSANGNLDDARQRLRGARDRIHGIKTDRDGVVAQTVGDIEEASKSGIQNKRWWQVAGSWVSAHWVDALDELSKFLDKYGTWITVAIIVVCVVLAPFTGGGSLTVIEPLMTAVSVLKIACDIVLLTQGRRSIGTVVFDAIDFIPIEKGGSLLKTVGKKAVTAVGLTGAKAEAKNASKGVFRTMLQKSGKKIVKNINVLKQFKELPGKRLTRTLLRTTGGLGSSTEKFMQRSLFKFVPPERYLKRVYERKAVKAIDFLVMTTFKDRTQNRIKVPLTDGAQNMSRDVMDRYHWFSHSPLNPLSTTGRP